MRYLIFLYAIIFTSCSNNNKAIKVKGSDTEVNLAVNLAENFYKVNNGFSVAISLTMETIYMIIFTSDQLNLY
ncbi:hypothetical protein LPB86_08875 [Pedobacter sp. MC2016-14]|uniref:hypothetical protein n=1 Tax=Pedobacter sp. MC2016-14 TaxID=2897327 RepID=UPI001E47ABC0|nr:hypothetical protein [Pedobacter sp. MC2016-14]MCD0488341.1 hypothetical protein [Pedobacter sp. MC2016-14]